MLALNFDGVSTGMNFYGGGNHFIRARGLLMAYVDLSHEVDVCGVALQGISWHSTGGYTYLHHPVPISYYWKRSDTERNAKQATHVVARDGVSFPNWSKVRCEAGICTWRTKAVCRSSASRPAFWRFTSWVESLSAGSPPGRFSGFRP